MSKNKVRTGCRTCKSRHLKCDERKPTCFRCEKSHLTCLGYPEPKTKSAHPRLAEARRLLPRPICLGALKPCLVAPSPEALSAVTRPNLAPGTFTGQDAIYFDFFRRQLVRDLSHLSSSSDFWTRHVIGQSVTDDCVRQSVLAIGASSQALHLQSRHPGESPGRPSVSLPLDGQCFLSEHHEAALAHHVEAVSMFRKFFTAEQPLARPSTVLIVTLLFIAFELLQGNVPAADSLITSGIMLLKDYIKMFRSNSRKPGALPPSSDDAFDDIQLILPRLAVMSTYSPFCISQRRHRNFSLLTSPLEVREPPPVGHENVKELRAVWNSCFTGSMVFIMRAVCYNLHSIAFDVADVKRKQVGFLDRLMRWRYVAEGYCLQAVSRTADPLERDCLRLVRIHHLFCSAFMECCLDASELSYDRLEPVFRELIRRCESFLGYSTDRTQSTLGVGVVPVLVFVAAKCRIHNTRMSAIHLLQRLPWREETWDMKTVVAGHLAQIGLEERGMDGAGFIPSHSRYIWAAGSWDADRSRLRATFTRAVPNDDGSPHRVELELETH